jgi:hypothetical protein
MKEGETLLQFAQRQAKEAGDTRKEAARYRTELRKLVGDNTPGDDGLTEYQRLQRQVEALNNDLTAERQARKADKVTTSLITGLAEAGAVNPGRAIRLIDIEQELELDQSGTPTPESVQAAIQKLAQDMPQIFNDVRGNADGGTGNLGNPDSNDINALFRARARR